MNAENQHDNLTPQVESAKKTLLEKTKLYLPYPDFIQKTLASITILIPFIFLSLGALNQIYILSEIGIEYMRFFSLSQLFSDSFIIFWAFFKTGFFSFILGLLITVIVANYDMTKMSQLFRANLIIFILFLAAFIFNYIMFYSLGLIIEIIYKLRFLIFGILFYLIHRFLIYVTPVIKNVRRQITLVYGYWLTSYFLILVISIFVIRAYGESKASLLPRSNFLNYEVIHQKYEAQGFKDSLLYFNDQYIFVQLRKEQVTTTQDSVSKIHILKFDKLFEQEIEDLR